MLAEKERHRKSERGRASKRRQSVVDNLKRRERTYNRPFVWTATDWDDCKRAWGECCAYCGHKRKLTQDHFIPISDPASPGTVPGNIVPACGACNSSKCNRSPYEWCANPRIIARILAYFAGLSVHG